VAKKLTASRPIRSVVDGFPRAALRSRSLLLVNGVFNGKLLPIIILLMLAFSPGRELFAQTGTLEGDVRGPDGNPLVGVVVNINRKDITQHFEVKTDIKGHFFHAGLPVALYRVSLIQGGKELSIDNIRVPLGDTIKVDFNLKAGVDFDPVANSAPWQAASGLAAGDLNGDGIIDVVGTSLFPTRIYLGFGDGRGSFRFTSSLDSQAKNIALSDFNSDGKPDLAATTFSGLDIFIGDGRGGFVRSTHFSYFWDGPSPLAATDLNGDGRQDLVVGLRGFSVFFGDGKGDFFGGGDFQDSQDRETSALVAGDFNRDGRMDVAILDLVSNRVSVALQTSAGGFARSANLSGVFGANGSGAIVTADFNRDGNLDLAANGPASITVFFGNGNGTFLSGVRLNAAYIDTTAACNITVAELDGDGTADLVITGSAVASLPSDHATEVFLSDGRGGFQRELAALYGGQSIVAAQLNNDGISDLAVASNFELSALLNRQTTPAAPTITSGITFSPGSTLYSVGQTLTAQFTITNRGGSPITFTVLTLGGRDPNGEVADFAFQRSITLNPGAAHNYQGALTLTKNGIYRFFVAYRTSDGQWHTDVPIESGSTSARTITVGNIDKGSILASPNPCAIPAGGNTCTVTLTWTTKDVAAANVWVQDIGVGGNETPFAGGTSGPATAPWIQGAPHRYIFTLYEVTTTGRAPITSVAVIGLRQDPSGTISASPNPCVIPTGGTTCTTSVIWSAQNVSGAEVWVQDIGVGGNETPFAGGTSGPATALWIQRQPHRYFFTLYSTGPGTRRPLAQVSVAATGGEPPPPQPVVRVIYLVPSDRRFQPRYAAAVQTAIRNIQIWYRNETGNGKTFSLNNPVVEIFDTSHAAAWYSNPAGEKYSFWNNVLADGRSLAKDSGSNILVFYIDADPTCGQIYGGSGEARAAVLPANDLRGLTGEPNIPPCADGQPDNGGPCRWVGGLGHELGHALSLPHPLSCEPMTATCPSNALMWVGYGSYPNTFLLPEEQSLLNSSPFFSVLDLPTALPNCSQSPVTLRIDVSTSSTRPQLQTFAFTGSNYSPGSFATRYLRTASSTTETALSPMVSVDANGNISWNFTPDCSYPPGTYYLRAVDLGSGRSSNTVTEIVTASPACPPQLPAISGFDPTSGSAGTSVTITGSNFSASTTGNTVRFNGIVAQVTSATSSSLAVTVPAGATSGPITVSTAGGTATSSGSFTVTVFPPPPPPPGGGNSGAYVANFGSNSVSVINPTSDSVVSTISTGAGTTTVTLIPGQAKLYVGNRNAGTLSVVSTSSNTVVKTIAVAATPTNMTVNASRNKLYVTHSSTASVSVIDLATDSLIKTIPVGASPWGLESSPNGAKVYVANLFGNSISVIDTATDTVTKTIAVGFYPYPVAFTPNGAKAYVVNGTSSSVSVIDVASDAEVKRIPVGPAPRSIAIKPDGTKAYVACQGSGFTLSPVSIIDLASDTVVKTVSIGGFNANLVVLTPNGAKAYVAHTGSPYALGDVSVIDTASDTLIKSLAVGNAPSWMSVTSNGSKIYVANEQSNNVSVIDTATDIETKKIAVGSRPLHIALSP